jgi:hypothetical protein
MTRDQSLFFRVLLFLAGAVIVVVVFFLFNGGKELTQIDAFVWLSIGLMYLIFFLPFFFSVINVSNFSGKIPSLSLVWLGIILYVIVSIVVILMLAAFHTISLKVAITIQLVLLFLFFIDVYFAYFASSHAGSVAAEENSLLMFIREIKTNAQSLSLSVNRLPAEYDKEQKILKQTLEDIKFISPVKNAACSELESRILRSLDILLELCGNIQTGVHSSGLESEAANLQMLVKERKLQRN